MEHCSSPKSESLRRAMEMALLDGRSWTPGQHRGNSGFDWKGERDASRGYLVNQESAETESKYKERRPKEGMAVGSCCYLICAIFVVLISIVIFLSGLALGGVGGFLLFGNSLIQSFINPIIDDLLSGVAITGFNIDASTMVKGLLDFLQPVSVALLIVGIFLIVLGFCGMFGPCCQSKCLLYTFTVLAGAILIAELGILIYVTTSSAQFIKLLGDYLLGIIQNEFVGIKATNFVSLLVNIVQAYVGCCGVYNGTDYQSANVWVKDFSYTVEGYNVNTTLEYPLTCCKMKNFQPVSINCTFEPNTNNSNYNVGCISGIQDLMDEYLVYVSAGVGGLFGLQVFVTLFGILMILHILAENKRKVDVARY